MELRLYDKNDKLYVYNVREPIAVGSTSNVYRISDNECLKYMELYSFFDTSIIERIIQMDLANFYKIYRILYCNYGYFAGYLMKYYPKEDIRILTMPVDYTLDNFYSIASSMMRLSREGIIARDVHGGNVIMNKDAITVIDVDFFEEEYAYSEEKLIRNNRKILLDLFRELYVNNMKSMITDPSEEMYKRIQDLYSPFNSFDMVAKKLEGYKYPIDYVRKKKQ